MTLPRRVLAAREQAAVKALARDPDHEPLGLIRDPGTQQVLHDQITEGDGR